MESIEVSDLYEASYLLLSKCHLMGVECVPFGGAASCLFEFSNDEETMHRRTEFRERRAVVDLDKFRTAYNTINGYMHQAKKSRDMEQRRSRRDARDSGELSGYVNKGVAGNGGYRP